MIYYKSELATVRDSKKTDIDKLAPNLREDDKKEIYRSHHQTPQGSLLRGFYDSIFCLSVVYQKRPIAMFGVVPKTILGGTATVWLLGSPEIMKIQRVFAKQSNYFIDLFLSHFSCLENFVDVENEQSIKWLKWLGAVFEKPAPYGEEKKLFRYFCFRREP